MLGTRGGKSHRYGLGETCRIVSCRGCGLIFPDPFPIPKDPQSLYGDPSEYFLRHDSELDLKQERKFLRDMRSRVAMTDPYLLDVGTGRGILLYAAKLEGIRAMGTEFSDAMISHGREKYGLKILKKSIEDLAAEMPETFDVVSLGAVIEHVYDPNTMVESAAKLLKKGGYLFIDAPNEPNIVTVLGNWTNRLMGSSAVFNLSPTWTPYHVYGFNKNAFTKLLEKYDLEIVDHKVWSNPEIPSKAGSGMLDRVRSAVASQLIRIGNLLSISTNQSLWARKGRSIGGQKI